MPNCQALIPDVIIHEDLTMDVIKAAEEFYKTPVLSLLSQSFVKRLVLASGIGDLETRAFVSGMTSTMVPDEDVWNELEQAYMKSTPAVNLFALQDSFMEHRILKNACTRLRIRSRSPTIVFLEEKAKRFSCIVEDTESRM
jgi:hypothetical protein